METKNVSLTPQEIDLILHCMEQEYGQIIAYDKKHFMTQLYLKLKKIYEMERKV